MWIAAKAKKPPQHMDVLLLMANKEVHEGRWLKDINKYVQNVNCWKVYKLNKFIPEGEVLAWAPMDNARG